MWETSLLAQISLSDYTTYELEVLSFQSSNRNSLSEKNILLNFNNLVQVSSEGDLYIRVNFLKGLTSDFLLQTAIAGTGYVYRVHYQMPQYRVSIIDKNGNLLLQKNYGGEKRKALFGEFESISSIEDLKHEWKANRSEFYAALEDSEENRSVQEMDEALKLAIKKKNRE